MLVDNLDIGFLWFEVRVRSLKVWHVSLMRPSCPRVLHWRNVESLLFQKDRWAWWILSWERKSAAANVLPLPWRPLNSVQCSINAVGCSRITMTLEQQHFSKYALWDIGPTGWSFTQKWLRRAHVLEIHTVHYHLKEPENIRWVLWSTDFPEPLWSQDPLMRKAYSQASEHVGNAALGWQTGLGCF